MIKPIPLSCPCYEFSGELDLEKVSRCIDSVLAKNFKNKKVVIRGIQSKKHTLPKEKLIQQIVETGSDRYASISKHEVKVSKDRIDLFGYGCIIKKSPIVLSTLEGFHKWKPKSLERPQLKLDIWMIYDASQLENIEYFHSQYGVKAKDGYIFKNPKDKTSALLGLIVIQ